MYIRQNFLNQFKNKFLYIFINKKIFKVLIKYLFYYTIRIKKIVYYYTNVFKLTQICFSKILITDCTVLCTA